MTEDFFSEEDKIKKGDEIKELVKPLFSIIRDSYLYSGKQREEAIDKIKEIWDTCLQHKFEWIDTNPYSEECTCIYCNADSPRTRRF